MKNIYHFDGNLKVKSSTTDSKPLELKNFIPRGAVVKNSSNVYACVLYTGLDTKLALNLGKYQFKISMLQKYINKFVVINIISLFFFDMLFSQVFHRVWHSYSIDDPATPEME